MYKVSNAVTRSLLRCAQVWHGSCAPDGGQDTTAPAGCAACALDILSSRAVICADIGLVVLLSRPALLVGAVGGSPVAIATRGMALMMSSSSLQSDPDVESLSVTSALTRLRI